MFITQSSEKTWTHPTPTMPTFFPGPQPSFFRGEYIVIPPHMILESHQQIHSHNTQMIQTNGAASSLGNPSGILKAYAAGLR